MENIYDIDKFKRYLSVYKKRFLSIFAGIFIIVIVIMSFNFGGDDYLLPNAKAKDSDGAIPVYDYTEAIDHIGENAKVKGRVVRVFKSKSDTTFLDYCTNSSKCSFSAVIFASDAENFSDISELEGDITISGIIRSYKGKAEIILESPEQIEIDN